MTSDRGLLFIATLVVAGRRHVNERKALDGIGREVEGVIRVVGEAMLPPRWARCPCICEADWLRGLTVVSPVCAVSYPRSATTDERRPPRRRPNGRPLVGRGCYPRSGLGRQ